MLTEAQSKVCLDAIKPCFTKDDASAGSLHASLLAKTTSCVVARRIFVEPSTSIFR